MALCLLLLACVPGCAVQLDAKGEAAYTTLKSVPMFATGGIGFAGTKSDGEKALRILLKQKQAEDALQSLLKEANPAGQMYALVGLKSLHSDAFEKAVAPFLTEKTKIKTMYGCMRDEETVAKVAADIRKGNHPLRPEKK